MQKIQKRMARKKSSGFPVRTLVFLVAFATGTAVIFDVKQNGSWESSTTFKTLKDTGVNDYVYKASNRAMEGIVWVQERFEEKFPGYTGKAIEVSEPYIKLTKQMSLFVYNVFDGVKELAVEKYPLVVESVNHNGHLNYKPAL